MLQCDSYHMAFTIAHILQLPKKGVADLFMSISCNVRANACA